MTMPVSLAEPEAATGLVLASMSPTRARLLADAGVPAKIVPASIDEDRTKRGLRAAGLDGRPLAERLAEAKAGSVDAPGRLVLGADQVLLLGGRVFDKPVDRAAAAGQLAELSGRTHRLVSAACIVEDGHRVWQHVGEARLTMRRIGERFLEDYLERIGDAALDGPGAYRIEGLGIQLFEAIEGDHATILGLPLLPLLAYLRRRGTIAE